MLIEVISWAAVVLIFITATTALTNRDWRVSLGVLAIQYLAVAWLVIRHLPFAMGSVKLTVGWIAIAILGMTRLSLTATDSQESDSFFPRGGFFRVALMGIVTIAAAGASPRIEAAIPGLGLPVITGGFFLIGAGVAHLGVTNDLLRVTLGLLTVLAGFECLYAAVESAILVNGLLAVVNLGLGILGSYLLIAGSVPLATLEEE